AAGLGQRGVEHGRGALLRARVRARSVIPARLQQAERRRARIAAIPRGAVAARPRLEVALRALAPRRLDDRTRTRQLVAETPLARRPLDDLVGGAAEVAGDPRLVLHLPRVIEPRVVRQVNRLAHDVVVL